MKNVYSIVLTTFFFGVCNAQITEEDVKSMIKTANEKELVIHSSQFLQENFYHFADLVTTRLLEISPENPNYNYRKGFILIMKQESPKEIIKFLSKCTKKYKRILMPIQKRRCGSCRCFFIWEEPIILMKQSI